MKTCSKCKRNKSKSEFTKKKSSSDGLNSACKECTRKTVRIHYKKNVDYYIQKSKKREAHIKEFIESIKEGSSCKFCPEDEPCCLDFHHLNPKEKEMSIGEACKKSWSDERILKEIKKCIIVCSNCHRKIHKGILPV